MCDFTPDGTAGFVGLLFGGAGDTFCGGHGVGSAEKTVDVGHHVIIKSEDGFSLDTVKVATRGDISLLCVR
jgi:hypothetical protein